MRPRRLAALLAVLALAAWARLAEAPAVLGSGELVPVGDGDSAYHLLRIRHAVEHFPRLPTVDGTMNWPYGAACPWADGFDLLAAGLARAAGARGDRDRVDVVAALVPVLLGLLVVWLSMDLAGRVARRAGAGRRATGVAFAAGVVAALLPQAVAASRFGRVDHHVAEALAMLLLGSWAIARAGPGRLRPWRWELAGAGAATFACWTFTGGPLYVALAVPVAAVAVVRERRPGLVGSGAPGLLAAAAATALLTVPALRQHGQLVSFQLPSLLQPLLVALAAVALALAVVVARRLPDAGPGRRLAALAAAGVALLAVAAVGLAGARHALVSGVSGWLLRHDPWLALVEEFEPIFGGKRGYVDGMMSFLGVCGVAAPLLVAAGGAWAVRRSPRGWGFAALSAALLAMAVGQLRFGRVFAPWLAVNVALGAELLAWTAARALRRVRLAGAATALAAVVVVAADPRLRLMLQPAGPGALPADAAAAVALRPAPGAAPERAPGVLAPWGAGHLVALLSGRPVVVNGFGAYLDEATFWRVQRLAAMGEADLERLMDERRVGYLLTGAPFIGPEPLKPGPGGWTLNPDAMRGLPLSPLLIAGSGIPDRGVPHVAHLMPIFASAQDIPGFGFKVPWLWGYARVPGARLTGVAAARARVVIELPFVERGRPHVYRAWTDAREDGTWTTTVPFPTGLVLPGVRSAARGRVRAGAGEGVAVEIPEDAVRRGAAIPVPPLPGAPRG